MSKRKKYNPLKQAQMLAKNSLKHSVIGCVPGKGNSQLIDLKSESLVPVTSNKFHLISSLRHTWSVFIAAFGVDTEGNHYMKANEINVTHPAFQSDMVEMLNSEHQKLCKNFNQQQLISVGWLATPYLKDWDEAHAFSLLEMLGALDFERNQNGEILEV